MKRIKINLKIYLLLFFFNSCISAQHSNKDFYDIINIMLIKAKENKDSIHIIDWKSKKYYAKSKENYDSTNFSILNFKESRSEQTFSRVRKYLAKNKINIDDEILFFKEQLKHPIDLEREKINLKEIKIFPTDSDWYSIKYNNNFTNYYYVLSKPLITKNGLRALYYHAGSDHANFFTILAKENNKWKIIDKFNADSID